MVNIMIQEADPPWRTYAFATVHLDRSWREFHVQGVTRSDEDGRLMITATQVERFAVDDVRVEESASSAAKAP